MGRETGDERRHFATAGFLSGQKKARTPQGPDLKGLNGVADQFRTGDLLGHNQTL